MRPGALGQTANKANIPNLEYIAKANGFSFMNPDDILEVVDATINEVTQARGRIGAMQSNSLEATLESLRTTVENLTASESRIRDTDYAIETAEFAKNNTILQAATAMMAQANQIPQTVLQLLQ